MSKLLIKKNPDSSSKERWVPPGLEGIDFCRIWLNPRVCTYVDVSDFVWLSKFHWRLKRSCRCWYACRRVVKKGVVYFVKMHREIMHTPPGFECHHLNKRTLDNRRCNLQNLTRDEHSSLHLTTL